MPDLTQTRRVVWVVAAIIKGDWQIVGAYHYEKNARLACARYKMAFIQACTVLE